MHMFSPSLLIVWACAKPAPPQSAIEPVIDIGPVKADPEGYCESVDSEQDLPAPAIYAARTAWDAGRAIGASVVLLTLNMSQLFLVAGGSPRDFSELPDDAFVNLGAAEDHYYALALAEEKRLYERYVELRRLAQEWHAARQATVEPKFQLVIRQQCHALVEEARVNSRFAADFTNANLRPVRAVFDGYGLTERGFGPESPYSYVSEANVP